MSVPRGIEPLIRQAPRLHNKFQDGSQDDPHRINIQPMHAVVSVI